MSGLSRIIIIDTDGIPELTFPNQMIMKNYQQPTNMHVNYSSGIAKSNSSPTLHTYFGVQLYINKK